MSEVYNPEPIYCANHPNVETTLRCRKCNKPICPKCAVLTDTGYKCRECVRGQQKVFETAEWFDYPLAFIVAAALAYAGSLVSEALGFFVIFLAPIAGGIIAEVVRRITNKRRSPKLYMVATAGVVLGSVIPLLGILMFGRFNLLGLLWPLAYAFLATSTFYYRYSGIRIG
jgi:hypothetical protein